MQPKSKGIRPPVGAVDLLAKQKAEQQQQEMMARMQQMQMQTMLGALQQPRKVTTYHTHAAVVLHGEGGYKLLQFGLPDGTRVEFTLQGPQVESLLTMLAVDPEEEVDDDETGDVAGAGSAVPAERERVVPERD